MRDKALFAGSALALSALLFWIWPAVTIDLEAGGQLFARGPFLIPVLAVILSARGVGLTRKLVFAGISLASLIAADVVAGLAGIQAVAAGCGVDVGYAESVLATVYLAFRRGFPLAVLLVFVGREPERLWCRSTGC
jgi:ABC-type amino acid transport system permease subunit